MELIPIKNLCYRGYSVDMSIVINLQYLFKAIFSFRQNIFRTHIFEAVLCQRDMSLYQRDLRKLYVIVVCYKMTKQIWKFIFYILVWCYLWCMLVLWYIVYWRQCYMVYWWQTQQKPTKNYIWWYTRQQNYIYIICYGDVIYYIGINYKKSKLKLSGQAVKL